MQTTCAGHVQLKSRTTGSENLLLNHRDALIVVDVQKDFLPGGNLAVEGGDEVIEPLNRYIAMFVARNLPVVISGDAHPPNHCSFKDQGGIWPPHCVAKTEGAAFAEKLALPDSAITIQKGTSRTRDAYSAFDGTDLKSQLQAANIHRVFVGGLATDYCVLQTTSDALKSGFKSFLLRDAIRAVDVHPDDGGRAEALMSELGAKSIQLEDLTLANTH